MRSQNYTTMKKPRIGECVSKGTLKTILNKVKTERSLQPDLLISLVTLRQRIVHDSVFASHPGHILPLAFIDHAVFSTIKQTYRTRQCLTPTQGIAIVNRMIEGTGATLRSMILGVERIHSCREGVSIYIVG